MPTRKNLRRKRRSIRGGASSTPVTAATSNKTIKSRMGAAKRFAKGAMKQTAEMGKKVVAAGVKSIKSRKTLKRCPNELTKGRIVQYNDVFYYVSSDGKQIMNNEESFYISNVDVSPYNYHDILDKILILLNIIFDNKYLKLDDENKKNKYLHIIYHIQSIMNNINEIDTYYSMQHVVAHPITMAKSVTTIQQGGGSCIEDIPSPGRLVQYNDVFYYVSLDGKQIMNNEERIDIPKDDVSPYDYDKVLSSLLSLFKIILEKKYLYDNNISLNHIDKMKIIKKIIEHINNIQKSVETIGVDISRNNSPSNNLVQNKFNNVSNK